MPKFTIDNTPYEEAILYPDGTRAFFLVPSGHGMPAKTARLAEKVVELLNALPEQDFDKIWPRQTPKMDIEPTPSDIAYGNAIFAKYRSKLGSKHMASSRALQYLSAVLRVHRPCIVVELGGGIGTMTDAMLSHPQGPDFIFCIEQNAFCQDQLRMNLAHHDTKRMAILRSIEDIQAVRPAEVADLIIGDGGFEIPEEVSPLREGVIIFAEGIRSKFRQVVADSLPPGTCVDFKEHGVVETWGLGPLPFFWRWMKLAAWPTKLRRKGCWVGRVARIG